MTTFPDKDRNFRHHPVNIFTSATYRQAGICAQFFSAPHNIHCPNMPVVCNRPVVWRFASIRQGRSRRVASTTLFYFAIR